VLGLTDAAALLDPAQEGLAAGDQVVALGAQLLHDGEKIRPASLATQTAAVVERGGLLK
jgi:hypothetical protein